MLEIDGLMSAAEQMPEPVKDPPKSDNNTGKKKTGAKGPFELPEVIAEGMRHDTLLAYAGQLKGKGVSDDEINVLLHEANEKRCEVPYPEDELMTIIDSAKGFSAGAGKNFNHAVFGDRLISEHHMTFVDGAPAIWDGRCYRMGENAVFSAMIDRMHAIRQQQRREVMAYLQIRAPHLEMADPRYIAFDNGVLDLETMLLIENTPDLLIPNVIPHSWNPSAVCPELDSALTAWACDNPERRANLVEVAGLCMYRGRIFHVCPIFTGGGGNGKSTYFNLLHRLLGEDNTSAMDIATIGERFQSVALIGKLANIGDDISNEFVSGMKLSVVKKVVTGDWVNAEYKGGATFKYRPYCMLVFSCNEVPRMGEATRGIYRRFVPIPFEATFSEENGNIDVNLPVILESEDACERLIYLGVQALQECIKRGGMSETEDRARMLEEMHLQNSSVYQYACEELGFGSELPESIHKRPTGELFESYKEFCDEANCKSVNRNRFSTEMCETYGCEIKRVWLDYSSGKKQVRCFCFADGDGCDA